MTTEEEVKQLRDGLDRLRGAFQSFRGNHWTPDGFLRYESLPQLGGGVAHLAGTDEVLVDTAQKNIRGIDFASASSEAVNSGTSIANIDDMTDFTVFVTFRPDTLQNQTIVSKQTAGSLGWTIDAGAFGSLRIDRSLSITNYTYNASSAGVVAGTVYRLVVRSSVSSGARFWLNGTELSKTGGIGSGVYDSEASSPLRVARKNSGNYFDGFIGALAIWNIAVPETACEELHTSDHDALPYAGYIQLNWPMNDYGDGTAVGAGTILDASMNGYDGTAANNPTGDIVTYTP